MMETPELLAYKIAISLIPGIGSVTARNLIAYVGSVEGVFQEKEKNLMKIPGIGEVNAQRVVRQNVLERAKQEVDFILKNKINTYFYLDENYPARLKNCSDSPIILYFKLFWLIISVRAVLICSISALLSAARLMEGYSAIPRFVLIAI